MGNASSSEEGAGGLGHPNLLTKVSIRGTNKSDVDAFLREGRVDNVAIAYITKKQHERFNPQNVNRHVVLRKGNLTLVKRNWAMISEQPETQARKTLLAVTGARPAGGEEYPLLFPTYRPGTASLKRFRWFVEIWGAIKSHLTHQEFSLEAPQPRNPSSGSMTPLVILYDTFFAGLFAREPSMRGMFEDNMIRQSKFLVGLVNIMVGMEGMLKQGLAPIYSFADRSVSMGVRPEHYEAIADVLPTALEACAGSTGWSKEVNKAWLDVMSFAILVVVERTVESWTSSHGMSLTEMWNSLSEWRSQTKRLHMLKGKMVSDEGVRRMSTLSTVASSMCSDGSNNGPPEAPPPLRQRGPRLESLVASMRSPTVTPGIAIGGGGGSGSLIARDACTWNSCESVETAYASPYSSLATGNGALGSQGSDTGTSGASGGGRGRTWGEERGSESSAGGDRGSRSGGGRKGSLSNGTFILSTAPPSMELDARNSACYLSDEPDAVSSNNSPTGDLQFGGRKFRGNGSGGLMFAFGGLSGSGDFASGESNGTSGSFRTPPVRTCPRDPPSRQDVETYRVGSTHSSNGADGAAITGAAGVNGTGAHPVRFQTMDVRSPNRSQSADGQQHTRRAASGYGAIGGDPRLHSGSVGEAAAGGHGGEASAGGFGAAGGDRSSLKLSGGGHGALKVLGSMGLPVSTFRRKKITRSASLEEDEELAQRRRRAAVVGADSRSSELSNGGMLRGRGRDGSMAMMAVYVRSQSVTDDALPQRRSGSAGAIDTSSDFDVSGEFPIERVRRKGIVSRMRRMGSNVIRFRSESSKNGTPLVNSSNNPSGFSSGSSGSSGGGGHSGHHYNDDGHGGSCGRSDFATRQNVTYSTASSATASATAAAAGVSDPNAKTSNCSRQTSRSNGGGGRKPAGRANSTGGVETDRDRQALSSRASVAAGSSRAATAEESSTRRSYSGTGTIGSVVSSAASVGRGGGDADRRAEKSASAASGEREFGSYLNDEDRMTSKQNAWGGGSGQIVGRNGGGRREIGATGSGSTGGERTGGGGNGNRNGRGNGGGSDGRGGGGGVKPGRPPAPVNPWRQMKLHVLMATLEDNTGEDTEKNFGDIAEAILYHLGPSEPPTTRALALDVAMTFVQRILSSRSKDKKSSKVRRRAFKEFLNRLIPLMLDCLKSPGGSRVPGDSARRPTTVGGKGDDPSEPTASAMSGEGVRRGAGVSEPGLSGAAGTGGEVVVLHYYQQHHQYQCLLKVAVLDTMNRFLMVLRALFRPPQSTSVQKAVAPLLDAEEEVLRDKAAAVLGKLSLCGKDNLKWVNIAIKVSLEAHNLLHDAWADEGVGQIPSKQVEAIMGDHPLLPPLQDTFRPGDAEAHVRAVGRRFPALCKLLATLITASPPKSHESDAPPEGLPPSQGGESSTSASNQRPLLVALTISLVQRVLRMGQQAWDVVDSEEADGERGQTRSPVTAGTLSPALAAGVTGLLLPPAVTLLEALVASAKLEDAMKDQQEAVCQCMGQAVAQMPVQGGVRYAAYRSMAVVIRYLQPAHAAAGLGVPVLPLLFNEALLALGNRVSLQPLNAKRDVASTRGSGATRRKAVPPLCFNVRTPANNGHGAVVHENTVWAGVECLAVLVLDCGLYLPPEEIAEIERVVTDGVELLANRPLEVSPFNEDEPQVLRHASTREAFVRLAHHYLLLSEGNGRNRASTLYSEAMRAFHCHLQDPDGAVASECRIALTELKGGGLDAVNGDRPRADRALEDMEAEADNELHGGENGYVLEEGENGEYHVVRSAGKPFKKANSPESSESAAM